jgi:MATE family multidrug resistance protein
VGQSLLMAVFWFGIGMDNGIASVAGNMMGKGNLAEVKRCFRSGLKIVGIFTIALFALLIFGKDWIIDLFLKTDGEITFTSLSSEQIAEARNCLAQSIFVLGAYVTIENIRCLLYGILRAAGDTVFILYLSVITTWLLLILPTYQLFTVMEMDVYVCFWVWIVYAIVSTGLCYLRFLNGNWNKGQLFGDTAPQESI